jgi:hypothetical protein
MEVAQVTRTSQKLLHGSNASILALLAFAMPHFIEMKTDIAVLKKQACECRRSAGANSPAGDLAQTNLLAKASHEQ